MVQRIRKDWRREILMKKRGGKVRRDKEIKTFGSNKWRRIIFNYLCLVEGRREDKFLMICV